jgi:SAM-dependent methyltransferase
MTKNPETAGTPAPGGPAHGTPAPGTPGNGFGSHAPMIDAPMPDGFLVEAERALIQVVPEALLRHTIGSPSMEHFHRSALEHMAFFESATIRHAGRRMDQFESILDFGCGAGRLLQMLPVTCRVAGCDPNGPLIRFASKMLPHADIYQSEPEPPLKWADGTFDLVYAYSVFSHLRRDSEDRWLDELARVGKPGCTYLLTVQGDWWLESKFDAATRARIRESGFWYFDFHKATGGEMDFPDNYGSSIHTSDYVKREWAKRFDVLQVYFGRPPALYDHDALTPAHRRALTLCRSLGQDLVVLRKR